MPGHEEPAHYRVIVAYFVSRARGPLDEYAATAARYSRQRNDAATEYYAGDESSTVFLGRDPKWPALVRSIVTSQQ